MMARYTIDVTRPAEKQIRALDPQVRARIEKTIDALAENPRPHGCQKMHGYENLYRARTGDWRVVYEIRDNVLLVLVVAVGHRREIYRGL
jgi:mRNA interferase RelE/StbE